MAEIDWNRAPASPAVATNFSLPADVEPKPPAPKAPREAEELPSEPKPEELEPNALELPNVPRVELEPRERDPLPPKVELVFAPNGVDADPKFEEPKPVLPPEVPKPVDEPKALLVVVDI